MITLYRLGVVFALALLVGCSRFAGGYIARGDELTKTGRHAEAVEQYRQAVNADPSRGEAHVKLGDALLRIGDAISAARAFFDASEILISDIQVQLKAAQLLAAGGHYLEAQMCTRRVLTLDPRHAEARRIDASLLIGEKRLGDAAAALQKVLETDPANVRAWADLGVVQLTLAPEHAESSFRRAVEIAPRSIDPRLTLASYYWASGRSAEAEAELRRALEIDTGNMHVHRALALVYLATRRLASAGPHLEVMGKNAMSPPLRVALVEYFAAAGRTAEAERLLRLARPGAEGFVDAWCRLATLVFDSGRRKEAYALVEEARLADTVHPRPRLTKAHFLLRDGRVADATTEANEALRLDPQSLPSQYMVAALRASSGATSEALRFYADILRTQPGSVAAKVETARLRLVQGDATAAAALLSEALSVVPGHMDTQVLLLRALMAQPDFPRAEQLAATLLDTGSARADVQWLVGLLRLQRGDSKTAREHFEQALQRHPDAVEPLDALIALDLAHGDGNQAVTRVESALQRHPTDVTLLTLAARTTQATGLGAKAEAYLRRAVDADPSDPAPYGALARLLVGQRQTARAIAELTALTTKYSHNVEAAILLGTLLEAEGRPAEARRWYERALTLDARAAVAANNLAWLLAEAGTDLDGALALARRAQDSAPDNPAVLDTLGWVHYKRDEMNSALSILGQVVDREPRNPRFHYHLGMAHVKAGNSALARASLTMALKLDAVFPEAGSAKSVLARLP